MPPKGGDKITPSWESLDSLLKIQIVESHPPAIFLSPLAILIQQVWRDLHFFFFTATLHFSYVGIPKPHFDATT